jgi:nicotinamide-nucleotide amidase
MNKNIRVEILAVGDELLYGSLVDTNSSYLAEQCQLVGMEMIRHSCVGDNLEHFVTILSEMHKRADIVIVTGGLGPTLDDLSREAAAKAGNVNLILNHEALAEIEAFFAKLGRSMPEVNTRQAYFPKDSQYLSNPIGTAPGFTLQIKGVDYFFVPGVPREMKNMLHEQVIPRILQKYQGKLYSTCTKSLNTFGISEGVLGEHLEAVAEKFPQVKFGTRAVFPEVQIKLYVQSTDQNEAQDLLNQATAAVNKSLGSWIYSSADQTMPVTILDLLHKEKSKIALTEIDSGGLLADWLTNTPNSFDILMAANVIGKAKFKPLFSELSSDSDAIMNIAREVQAAEQATYSIVVYGIIADGLSKDNNEDAGTVYIAIADKDSVVCYLCSLPLGGVEYKKRFFATLALDLLRRKILKLEMLNAILGKQLHFYKNYANLIEREICS